MRSMMVAGALPDLNAVILAVMSVACMPPSARMALELAAAAWQPVHDDAPAGASAAWPAPALTRTTATATETSVAFMPGQSKVKAAALRAAAAIVTPYRYRDSSTG